MTPDQDWALSSWQALTRDSVARLGTPGPLTQYPAFVGRVFGKPKVPTSAGAFVWVYPVSVGGTETEGGPAALAPDTTRSLLVYVIGPKPALAGDDLVCRFVGHRWVAERSGKATTGITIPGCPCGTTPAALTMTSSRPDSNYGLFQNATLAYGPTPAAYAPLQLGPNCYLSPQWFTDRATNGSFQYYFTCYFGYYILSRVFVNSVYGSPFRDQTRYHWLVGTAGNTCEPFLLSKGVVFTGGDPSCVVTVSE